MQTRTACAAAGLLTTPVVVGRGPEVARLRAALTRVKHQRTSVTVAVTGEAGIGKTRLVRHFLDGLEPDGAPVVAARCVRLSSGALDGAAAMLATLCDQLPGDAEHTATWSGVAGRLHGLARERTVVVWLDDVQWAPPALADLVRMLLAGWAGAKLLTIVSFRTGWVDDGDTSSALVTELGRARVETVALRRLGRVEVEQQITALRGSTPPAELVRAIFDRGEGNPLFTEELVAAEASSTSDVPAALAGLLTEPLGGLGPHATRVLRALACSNGPVRLAMLGDVTGCAEADSIRELLERRLIDVDRAAETMQFRHPLAREAVYGELMPDERRALHASFARALESAGVAGDASCVRRLAEVAHHWTAAEQRDAALHAAHAAAVAADRAHSPTDARRWYGVVLAHWPLVAAPTDIVGAQLHDVLLAAAAAASRAGAIDDAVDLASRAMAAAEQAAAPAGTLIECEERLGWYLLRRGEHDRALDLQRSALARVGAAGDAGTRCRTLSTIGHSLLRLGHLDEAAAACDAAIAAGADGGPRTEAIARRTRALVRARQGDAAAAISELRRATDLARAVSDPTAVLWAQLHVTTVLGDEGRRAEAVAANLATAADVEVDWPSVARFLRCLAGDGLRRLGRLDEAHVLARMAQERADGPLDTGVGRVLEGRIELDRGRLVLAREHLVDGRDLTAGVAEPHLVAATALGLAACAYWDRRYGEAVEIVRDSARPVAALDAPDALAPLLLAGVRAAVEQRAHQRWARYAVGGDDAERWLEELATLTSDAPHEREAVLVTSQAEIGRLDGDDPARWEAAAGAWEMLGQPLDVLHARWGMARALIARGHRADARPLLDRTHRDAAARGATHLVAGIELTASRARIALSAPAGLDASPGGRPAHGPLTSRELEVLRLLARACDNHQIAEQLYISPKTASVHVSNICLKLHARNRYDAVVIATDHGLLAAG